MPPTRRFFILASLPFFLILPAWANVTGLSEVDLPDVTYEATTTNDLVLAVTITDDGSGDTLQSFTVNNIDTSIPARQPQDLSAVRLLLDADGNTSNGTTNLGTMTVDATNQHWTITFSTPVPVAGGDTLYVAVDVQGPASILGGQRIFDMEIPDLGVSFTNSGSFAPSPIENQSDIYLTSQIPPNLFVVGLTDTMPSTIGVGQLNVPMAQLNFTSDPSAGHSYDAGVFIKSLIVSFFDGATQIDPTTAIASMSVSSPSDRTVYYNSTSSGFTIQPDKTLLVNLTQIYSNGPSFNPAYPNSLLLKANLLSAVTLSTLRVQISAPADVVGDDSYSGRLVTTTGSFPLQSSSAVFQHAATVVQAGFTTSGAVTQVSKGSTDDTAFKVRLSNPGAANTGIAQLNSLAFTLTDGSGNGLVPSQVLRWVRVDDGRFTYLSRAVTESAGSTVVCNPLLLPVNLAVDNPVTLQVSYDVLPAAIPLSLQFHVNPFPNPAWSVVEAGTNTPVALSGSSFDGPIVPIVAAFQVSHVSRIPSILSKGQTGVSFLDLNLLNPGPAPVGPIVVDSIAFHLQDRSGGAVDSAQALQNPRLLIGSAEPAQTAAFSGDQTTIHFTSGVTLSSTAGGNAVTLSFLSDISSDCPADSLNLRLVSGSDITAHQPSDPNRTVWVQPSADTFPMGSGTSPLQGVGLKDSFTNYPNPFHPGSENTRFTYRMNQAGIVTLRLFSLTGAPVRKLISGELRSAGLQTADAWDGRNDSGRIVLNGLYLAVLEINSGGEKSTVKRYVAVVK